MIEESVFSHKVKRHRRRWSRQRMAYHASSFGMDHIIWRSLCAMYTQVRIEKDQLRYLTFRDMTWLLAMKQFCVDSGQDAFHMREIRRYINFNFKSNVSAKTSMYAYKKLTKAGYLALDGFEGTVKRKSKIVLTMKARAFYQDLYKMFSI